VLIVNISPLAKAKNVNIKNVVIQEGALIPANSKVTREFIARAINSLVTFEVHVYRETKWAVESPGQLRRLRAGVLMAGSPLATSLS